MLIWLTAGLTLLLLGAFWFTYRRNKWGIASGFWFNGFVLSLLLLVFLVAFQYQIVPMMLVLAVAAFFAVFVLLFGIYVLIALLLWNARAVLKRERHSLANSLTLLLGLGLLVLLVVSFVLDWSDYPLWAQCLRGGFHLVVGFYVVHVYLFLSSAVLANFARPKKEQDFIVVLGAGLVNGNVSSLLRARIDKAAMFYRSQKESRIPPKLVMSGGQGPDEPRSEAEAMAEYAVQLGIPPEDILLEKTSTNTLENMKNSKCIMDAEKTTYKSIFSTSNYHVLRAGMYAKQAGLPMDGIGGKTAAYYLPNAMLREYVAFLVIGWKSNIAIALALFGVGAFLQLVPYIL